MSDKLMFPCVSVSESLISISSKVGCKYFLRKGDKCDLIQIIARKHLVGTSLQKGKYLLHWIYRQFQHHLVSKKDPEGPRSLRIT